MNSFKDYSNFHLDELLCAIDEILMFHIDIHTGEWIAEPNRQAPTFLNRCSRMDEASVAKYNDMRGELVTIICSTMITLHLNGYEPPPRSAASRREMRRRKANSTTH